MPFFKDLGKAADDLLDGKGKKHFAGADKADWFKFGLGTTANNSTKFAFSSEPGKNTAAMSFSPFDGLNVKKVQVNQAGEYALEGEYKGLMDNVTLGYNIETKKNGSGMKKGADDKYGDQEKGEIACKYSDKAVAANFSVDVLCSDGPKLAGDITYALADGLTVGASANYRTGLDTFGSVTGVTSLLTKAADSEKSGAELAVGYNVSDAAFSAKYTHGGKKMTVGYHQALTSDLTVCAQVNTKGFGKFSMPAYDSMLVGSKYKYDKDTTVFTKLDPKTQKLTLGVTQKVTSALTLNLSSQVTDLKSPLFSGVSFGLAYKN